MAELITESLEAYEDLAVGLATDHNRRAALRTALSANRATHPLFDTTRYVRNLERAYTEIVRLHREGRAPEPIILE
jgi:predicted O-linked N-acetylglucosamine transferase (SPINDLY family)